MQLGDFMRIDVILSIYSMLFESTEIKHLKFKFISYLRLPLRSRESKNLLFLHRLNFVVNLNLSNRSTSS